ncbi:hypothetical protein [Gemmobacter serpentinus]|uniref:hypothetical protein n=1 Tax=Gemmobacter serpentinus TaxID=2652247 RepID=UPI00124BF03F|nr:hypothetical protein [Gemmobacter serpentinus]
MRAPLALLLLALPLAACGPVSREQAERDCFARAWLAKQPRGEVGAGINSRGQTRSHLKLEVSADYIQGRDPSAVYDSCVYQKSGQLPSQPLYSRPDWKG